MRLKHYNDALSDLTISIILADESNKCRYYNTRADIRVALRDYQGAIRDIDFVICIEPNNYLNYDRRCFMKYKSGDLQGALKDCDHALELNPESLNSLMHRCAIKNELKDYIGSMADANRVIDHDKNNAVAYINRANSKSALNDSEGSIEDYHHALQLNPVFADAWRNLGFEYCKSKQLKLALAAFEQYVELNPNEIGMQMIAELKERIAKAKSIYRSSAFFANAKLVSDPSPTNESLMRSSPGS